MKKADYAELKKGGMMRQTEEGRYSVRLHVTGGGLSARKLAVIAAVAERFGRGDVHLTARQGVEIPHVAAADLAAVKEALLDGGLGVGVCGPTVRTVTACLGCTVCPSGVIDAAALAETLDATFYGKPAPHKFKLAVTGCANNCMKVEENDLGVKGWIEPCWHEDDCNLCGICAAVCPSKSIAVSADAETHDLDLDSCIGCGDCIAACPSGGMRAKGKGYLIYAGGKFGRTPLLGRRVGRVLRTPEEVVKAARLALDFFRAVGKPKERFGDTLARVGFDALESHLGRHDGGHQWHLRSTLQASSVR